MVMSLRIECSFSKFFNLEAWWQVESQVHSSKFSLKKQIYSHWSTRSIFYDHSFTTFPFHVMITQPLDSELLLRFYGFFYRTVNGSSILIFYLYVLHIIHKILYINISICCRYMMQLCLIILVSDFTFSIVESKMYN